MRPSRILVAEPITRAYALFPEVLMERSHRTLPTSSFPHETERAIPSRLHRQGNTVAPGLGGPSPRQLSQKTARLAQQLQTLLRSAMAGLHCCVCGAKRRFRGSQTAEAITTWLKTKKCTACVRSGRVAGDFKYCRVCGTEIHREGVAAKAWASVACCPTHKPKGG